MKSLHIIGDSHTLRMGHILFENISNKLNKEIPYSTYHTNSFDKVLKKDHVGNPLRLQHELYSIKTNDLFINCAAYLGRPALTFDYDIHHYIEYWDDKKNTIIPWLGYIDIKNYLGNKNLSNYKGVQDVVEIYVKNTLNKFKNSNIIFASPIPQFEVIVTARWRNFSSDPDIDFEKRHEIHLEFCEILKNKCLSLGLTEPIDIGKILDVPWVGPTMQYKTPLHYIYNDHCRPEYYNKILNYFLDYTGFNIGP